MHSLTKVATLIGEKVAMEANIQGLEDEVEIGLHTEEMLKKNANETQQLLMSS